MTIYHLYLSMRRAVSVKRSNESICPDTSWGSLGNSGVFCEWWLFHPATFGQTTDADEVSNRRRYCRSTQTTFWEQWETLTVLQHELWWSSTPKWWTSGVSLTRSTMLAATSKHLSWLILLLCGFLSFPTAPCKTRLLWTDKSMKSYFNTWWWGMWEVMFLYFGLEWRCWTSSMTQAT